MSNEYDVTIPEQFKHEAAHLEVLKGPLLNREEIDPAILRECRDYIIDQFNQLAYDQAQKAYRHYVNEFELSLENYNPVYFRQQLRMKRKHPILQEIIENILGNPELAAEITNAAKAGKLQKHMTKLFEDTYSSSKTRYVLERLANEDFDVIDFPDFMRHYVKLMHSGNKFEILKSMRAIFDYLHGHGRLCNSTMKSWLKSLYGEPCKF